MLTNSILRLAHMNRVSPKDKDQNVFTKKLRKHINQEIHLKIEQDDTPINYTLKEVNRDHIVVLFAHMERVIPMKRIVYFQTETKTPAPSSPI